MEFRLAQVSDAPAISNLYCQSWKQAYAGMINQEYLDHLSCDHWTAAFEKWIGEDLYTVQLAYQDSILAGAIAYGPSREKPDWGEIQSIYILPTYWHQGVGTALMQKAVEDFKRQGFQRAYLWVLDQNKNAQRFYQSLGFQPTDDTFTQTIHGQELLDFRYEKML